MKILVTGGAGYIGAVLVPMLLRDGYEVTVVDNYRYNQPALLDCCSEQKLDIIRGDVRDEAMIGQLLKKVDIILPLACLTGAPLCDQDPEGAQQINYDAVRNLAKRKSRDQQLIFPCTNSGYGVGEQGIHCDENTPLRPISLYGRLKVELEQFLLEQGDCLTFRFATLFGASPRMRLDLLVNDFTYRAVVDGTLVLFEPHFTRNFLHVRDASRAFVHGIEQYSTMVGRPYNVGLSDANLSKSELCDLVGRYVPGFRPVSSDVDKDPDQRNYIVSNSRIEKTGYQPRFSLEAGIVELIKVFQIIRLNQYSNI